MLDRKLFKSTMDLSKAQIIEGIDPALLAVETDTVPLSDARKMGFLRFWPGASRLDVHAPADDAYVQYATAGKKEAIYEFSDKSRLGLMKKLSTVRRKSEFRAITLTYKANVQDPTKYKRDLHSFLLRLRADYPHVAAIWKLEFQERGAAHLHILFWGGWVSKDWVTAKWDRIAGNDFAGGPSASTRVEYPRNARNATSYMLSYLSKQGSVRGPHSESIGRLWGVHNRAGLPFVSSYEFCAAADFVRGILDTWSDRLGVPWRMSSVTIFLTDTQAMWLESLLKSPP